MSAEIDGKVLKALHCVGPRRGQTTKDWFERLPLTSSQLLLTDVLWGSFVAYSLLPHGHFSEVEK